MTTRIKYLSLSVADQLHQTISENLFRYRSGNFFDLAEGGGWAAELSLTMDKTPLSELEHSNKPEAELENSLLVWKALGNLPPSVAAEGRVWARFAHIECLDYCRARWLNGINDKDIEKSIRKHFFAFSLTQYRDDHALSRLWWNYYIASRIYPENPPLALENILKSADIRSNFIERPWISTRIKLARGILRNLIDDPWLTEAELNFREFMKAINRLGSGVVFEILEESEIDKIIKQAKQLAEIVVENTN